MIIVLHSIAVCYLAGSQARDLFSYPNAGLVSLNGGRFAYNNAYVEFNDAKRLDGFDIKSHSRRLVHFASSRTLT